MRQYRFLGVAEDSNQTRLSGVLTNQPWLDYAFGSGVNAITGSRGVEGATISFKITNYPALIVTTSFYSISSEQDMHRAYGAEAKGEYNTTGIKIAASASFLNDASFSESSMTLVVVYDIRTNGVGISDPSVLRLSEAANAYLHSNGEAKFRERYGDYFVSSCTAGSRFVATYNIYTSSSSSLLQFKTSVSVSTNMASAEGAVRFEQECKASQVSINCKYHFYGINGIAPNFGYTPTGIAEALNWFLDRDEHGNPKNLAYIPMRAFLTHFSALSDDIVNTYPIPAEVFADIQGLRSWIGSMDSLVNQLPSYFLNQPYKKSITFDEERVRILAQLSAAQDTLPHRGVLVDELQNRTSDLCNALRPSIALVGFYNNLKVQADTEKSEGRSTRSFGTASNPPGVSITVLPNVESKSQKASGWAWERRKHTFSYSNPDLIIVGWKIQDNWGDDTNGKWYIDEAIIGRSSAEIKVEGEKGRGIDWTAAFYTVSKSSFPWISSLNADQ